MAIDPKPLINVEQGLVDRRIFIDRDIYEQELEKLLTDLALKTRAIRDLEAKK